MTSLPPPLPLPAARSLLPPPLPLSVSRPLLPPPALSRSPTSAQVIGAVAQFLIGQFIGFAAGIYGPTFAGQRRGDKPFDDYRIPAAILLIAVVMVLLGVLTARRRLWFFCGFSAGASLSLAIMGLFTLVFTYMHFL